MERLLWLAWICVSLTSTEGAIKNRGHRLLIVRQSDLRAQWWWINSELNLARPMKRNKKMGCREDGQKGEEAGGEAIQM